MKRFFLLLCCACLLTGCWDKREMEDRSYVITMGVDAITDGEGTKYVVSLAPAQLSALSEKGNSEEKDPAVVVTANTLGAALTQADCLSSRQMYLGQLKTILFGQGLLENKLLFTQILDELERNQDISEKLLVLATQGEAQPVIGAILKTDSSTGLFISDFYKNMANDMGVTQQIKLERLLTDLRNSHGSAALPKITLEEDKLKIGGSILLNGYQYLGALDDSQAMWSHLMLGKGKGSTLEGSWDGIHTLLWIYRNKSDFDFYEENDQLHCLISVDLSGNIKSGNFLGDPMFDSKSIKKMENQFGTLIKTEIENTIKLAQQEYKADIFDISNKLQRENNPLFLQYGGDTARLLENTIFSVAVDLNIRSVGMVQ